MIIKKGVKLHINLGNYESVELWSEIEFEVKEHTTQTLSDAQYIVDEYLKDDLKEAIECSGMDANSSFAHHWKSGG